MDRFIEKVPVFTDIDTPTEKVWAIRRLYMQVLSLMSDIESIIEDISSQSFKDVYIGAAEQVSSVLDSSHHYGSIGKGVRIPIDANDEYIWIVAPSEYNIYLMIGGLEAPIAEDSTTTISGKTYKVWKSSNTYTDTFNIYLN